MVTRSTASFSEPEHESAGRRRNGLTPNFEHDAVDATDLAGGPAPGSPLHLINPADRLFFEDNPSIMVGPSMTRRVFRAVAVFSLPILIGVGGTFAWRSYDGGLAMIKTWAPSLAGLLPTSTSKSAAAPVAAEIQQQLKSIAADLAVLRQTVEQLSANQDQLTHTQEQMSRTQEQMSRTQEQMTRAQAQMAQSITTLQAGQQLAHKPSPPPPAKPIYAVPKPASNLPPPQSLAPPDNK